MKEISLIRDIQRITTSISFEANSYGSSGKYDPGGHHPLRVSSSRETMAIPLFTILVLSLPERLYTIRTSTLLQSLWRQCQPYGSLVELIVFTDNRQRSIGRKRNEAMALAQGKYLAFVDDDDAIADDYVSIIVGSLQEYPETDCLVFDVWVCGLETIKDFKFRSEVLCLYGKDFPHYNLPYLCLRKSTHWMVHLTRQARSVPFPDVSMGEDEPWGAAMAELITHEYRLNKILYYYIFDYRSSTSMAVLKGRSYLTLEGLNSTRGVREPQILLALYGQGFVWREVTEEVRTWSDPFRTTRNLKELFGDLHQLRIISVRDGGIREDIIEERD